MSSLDHRYNQDQVQINFVRVFKINENWEGLYDHYGMPIGNLFSFPLHNVKNASTIECLVLLLQYIVHISLQDYVNPNQNLIHIYLSNIIVIVHVQ